MIQPNENPLIFLHPGHIEGYYLNWLEDTERRDILISPLYPYPLKTTAIEIVPWNLEKQELLSYQKKLLERVLPPDKYFYLLARFDINVFLDKFVPLLHERGYKLCPVGTKGTINIWKGVPLKQVSEVSSSTTCR